MTQVDPQLVARFNQAAAHARAGDHAEALRAYRALVEDASRDRGAPEKFVVTARMRAAFCLMDLGHFGEAEAELASLRLASLDDHGRYEVHFARGNSLGRLGRHVEAFHALVEAISCAEEADIEDEGRVLACWAAVFEHGRRAGDLRFVREKAAIALNTARLRGFELLGMLAESTLEEHAA